jgi:ketosteroid isomerase-like protein
MNQVLLMPLLLALSAFSPAAAGQPSLDRAAEDLQAVQQALYEGGEALARNDADALERYYASEWLSVSPAGVVLASGKGFSATRSGELVYDSIEIADPVTRVYGQTAVSTSRVTVKGRHKGQDIGGSYRVSTTLVKKGGRWQIIALVTSPAAASPPPAS